MTGSWSQKALVEARKEGETSVVWDGADTGFITVPDLGALDVEGAAYLHVTSNETIHGVEFPDGVRAGAAGAARLRRVLETIPDGLPTMPDYRTYARNRSLYNTPPVFSIYVLVLVTRWLRDRAVGGRRPTSSCSRPATPSGSTVPSGCSTGASPRA